jgi:NAD(P)-dependent dehydrogenase (short-subunit alcohol dehydrogenase family)
MTAPTTPKIALVTGANRGLGRSSALALAADGVDVVLTYRSHEEEAKAVVAEVEALGRTAVALRLDTARPDTFPAFVDALTAELAATWRRDAFDVLVNNAGHAGWTPLGGIELDAVRSLLDTHVVGVVLLTQALVPHLADGGRIINTSTGLARFTGEFGYSVYASAKGAIEVWTRYLAQELGPRRITVNAIAPGATGTDFAGGALRDDEQVRARLGGVIAMGHVGRPEDIGSAVAAIASDRMGWVTGQRIEASGGMRL